VTQEAEELGRELAAAAQPHMQRIAQARRGMTLEEFAPVLRANVEMVIAEELASADLAPEKIREIVAKHVHASETRLSVGFNEIAADIIEYLLDARGA
jgi:hypothetical protein